MKRGKLMAGVRGRIWVAVLLVAYALPVGGEEAEEGGAAGAAVGAVLGGVAEEEIPPALEEYKGRKIAQTMHWMGAEWLVRTRREREEASSVMFRELELEAGQKVCDLGCGNGFHTLPMAEAVGEEGRVYAVDIQPEMLKMLRMRADKEGKENIVYVQGELHDPKLPEGVLDLVLLVDVYHEFSHPEHMLRAIRASLKPGGRVALVEYRAEDETVPIKPEHKMSKEQIMKEFPPNGFRLVGSFDALPWQHLMFFEAAEIPAE